MGLSTNILRDDLVTYMQKMISIRDESPNLRELYSAEINGDTIFGGLTNDEAATVSTKLTKQEVNQIRTITDRINNFLGNSAVAAVNIEAQIKGIVNGNDERQPAAISPAIEDFGERGVALAAELDILLTLGIKIIALYEDSNTKAAVDAISVTEELPWYDITKTDFTDAIKLVTEFGKLLTDTVPATDDYDNTVSNWLKIITP